MDEINWFAGWGANNVVTRGVIDGAKIGFHQEPI